MSTKNIVFIDSRVSDYQSFIDGLSEPAEVFILEGGLDGVAQMADYLNGRTGIDAIHVISHGSQGALYLGGTVLDSGNLDAYGLQLASIGSALTPTGDILLYGCNVAQGDVGVQFITSLAHSTGGDVAASDDLTGAADFGGDGELEQVSGSVEPESLHVNRLTALLAVNTAPTFVGSGGKITTDFFGLTDYGSGITLQRGGKILVAGTAGNSSGGTDFALARYNPNGSLDSSFDGDGKVTTDLGLSDKGSSVTLQNDGKILVAGYATDSSNLTNFALLRFNSNGSLDTSFDGDGKVTTDFGSYSEGGNSVTLQNDGKILVAGRAGDDFALTRYSANGSLDTSFDIDGKLTTDFFGEWMTDYGNSIVLQIDGKILVAGTAGRSSGEPDFALARYNPNGSLDTSFDGDGKLTTDFFGLTDYGNSISIQTDGKILVAGIAWNSNNSSNFALARYNSNGSLDTSFDGDGKLSTDFYGSYEGGTSITLQTDGKILVAGYVTNIFNGSSYALARYNSNGSLDTSFDGDGKLTTLFGSNDGGNSVTLQSDGKILVTGYSVKSVSNTDFALVRYNTNGSLDTSFGDITTFSLNPVVLDANVLVFDTELRQVNNYSGSTLTLMRHSAASINDVFSAKTSGTLSALTSGSFFSVGGVTIGMVVSNSDGSLQLGFNSNATQSLVIQAIRQIAYANTADTPPAQVEIDWNLKDGNTGAQGTGGAMAVTGTTLVNITARNVAPVVSQALTDVSILPNAPMSFALPKEAFFDANEGDPLIFSISMNNGTALPTWMTFNAANRTISGNPGTLGVFDLREFDIKVTATDIAGFTVSDVFRLTVTNGTLTGNISNETFYAGRGNDTIDGGAGIDTVIFGNMRVAHTITKTSTGYTVFSVSDGTDALQNVERLKFFDTSVALDIDGNGGQAYRVYQAAFNRTPDAGGLGFWINAIDSGASLRSIAEGFVGSAEFKALYGTNPTNSQIVTKLYDNVLHRPGETGGYNFWLGVLDSKADTLAGVLAAFSESAENQAGLVGVIGNGFAYTPFA